MQLQKKTNKKEYLYAVIWLTTWHRVKRAMEKNSNGCKTLIYCCNEWTLNFLCRKTEDCSLQFEQKVILIYVIQISLGFSTRLNKHVCCRLSISRVGWVNYSQLCVQRLISVRAAIRCQCTTDGFSSMNKDYRTKRRQCCYLPIN